MINFYDIPTHENYEISINGDVRNKKTGKMLKHSMSGTGYFTVYVDNANRLLHRLVAEAFIPNPNNLPCVNHKDGNKLNNSVENLEWCTYSENNRHARKTGLNPYIICHGEKSRNHKLTWEAVKFIRQNYKRYDPNYGAKALSEKYEVSMACISAVAHGKSW